MFIPTDQEIADIVEYLMKKYNFIDPHSTGKNYADPFVVAIALVLSNKSKSEILKEDITVVNYESGSGNPKSPKLPDVVKYEGFKNGHLINIFKNEGIKWEK